MDKKIMIWKPRKPAPILKKSCRLSFDAQRIITAIKKQQYEESSPQKGVSNYYKEIYRKKFCAQDDRHEGGKLLEYNEQSQMCFSQKQVPVYYGDGRDLNTHRRFKPSQFLSDTSKTQRQLLFEKGNEECHIFSQELNQPKANTSVYNNQNSDSSSFEHRRPLTHTFSNTINTSFVKNAMISTSVSFNSNKRMRNYTVDSTEVHNFPFSMATQLQKHSELMTNPTSPMGSNTSNLVTSNCLSSSLAPCCVDETEKGLPTLPSPDDIVINNGSEFIRKSGSNMIRQCNKNIEENSCLLLEEQGTLSGTTPKRNGSISSKIARRLYEHKNRRQEDENIKEEFCEIQQNAANRPRKTLHEFFIPYKKKRHDDKEKEQEDCKSNSQRSFCNHNVVKMSQNERRNVFKKFLQSKETAITLQYLDGSTQLRENVDVICHNSTKKKSNTVKIKTESQVSGIYMKCRMDPEELSRQLLYIPKHARNDIIQEQIKQFLKDFIKSDGRKVCFNAKDFLIAVLRFLDNTENCQQYMLDSSVCDPVVAEWLLNPDKSTSTFQQMLADHQIQQKHLSIEQLGDNSTSEDMDSLLELIHKQFKHLCSKNLMQLFLKIETKLTPVLAIMDTRTIKVSTDTLLEFSNILKKKMESLEHTAHKIVGHSFSISSPAQIRQIIFEELKLHTKLGGKTKLAKTAVNHQLSTSESVLTQLSDFHPLPAVILEYRQLQKLKSTYIDGMMSAVVGGYLSTHWDQTSAATGRLSSHSPNIQAIPKTPSYITISETAKDCIMGYKGTAEKTVEIFARDSFVSHEGWSFLSADFQQIELRLLAHLANDSSLLQLFNHHCDKDIFKELTAQWLKKLPDDVTSVEREQTKRIVYSVMYGAGKEKLAEYLKITPTDAKNIIDSFLVSFPAVNHFSRKCIEFCRQKGYTESIFKRKRRIPNICHPSPPFRAQAERKAVNFSVQGSAADICKSAMLQVENTLGEHSELQVRLLVQIHDELLFEIQDEHLSRAGALIKSVMEDREKLCGGFVQLRVPLRVSLCAGKTWGHMIPLQNTDPVIVNN